VWVDVGNTEYGPHPVKEFVRTNVTAHDGFNLNEFKEILILEIDVETLRNRLEKFVKDSLDWSKYTRGIEYYE